MQLTDEDRCSSFVDTIKSQDRYRRTVEKYQCWCTAAEITWEDPRHVERYIVEMHSNYLEKPKSENSFCGKTCWSVVSMISAYFQAVRGISLAKECPSIEHKLKQWQKTEKITKAESFTFEEVMRYWTDFPDDCTHLVRKVVSIIAFFGVLRCAEYAEVDFEDVDTSLVNTPKPMIIIKNVERRKNVICEVSSFGITHPVAIAIIMKYIACFPIADRRGFLLYKLTQDMKASKQKIGRNMIGDYGKQIAGFLGLEEPNRFTSHCWRRSGASSLAEHGANEQELQSAGNWASGKVAMSYISGSLTYKRKLANMLAPQDDFEEGPRPPPQPQTTSSSYAPAAPIIAPTAPPVYSFSNCNNCVINVAHQPSLPETPANNSPLILRLKYKS